MSSGKLVLILGAGPRVGAAVAEAFAKDGYQVAVTSRKGTGSKTPEGYLSVKGDFGDPESIKDVFSAVKSGLGAYPSVVVYNAAALTPPPDSNSVLSIPASSIAKDMNVNTISAYAAAQEAVKGWATLPESVKKTFIYTGNIANRAVVPVPMMFNLNIGKAASAAWIGFADTVYRKQGYRFFYADERNQDGTIKGQALDGPAHAEFFTSLAEHTGEVPWDATFVKGKGYTQFP